MVHSRETAGYRRVTDCQPVMYGHTSYYGTWYLPGARAGLSRDSDCVVFHLLHSSACFQHFSFTKMSRK